MLYAVKPHTLRTANACPGTVAVDAQAAVDQNFRTACQQQSFSTVSGILREGNTRLTADIKSMSG